MSVILSATLPAWEIAVITIAAVLTFIILFLVILACTVHHIAFGRRYDRNPLYTYFSAEDFGLSAEPTLVPSKRTTLHGYIYSYGEDTHADKIIIFCHGLGPGHCAYMTEISYLCRLGYTVAATDYCGCGETPGRKARGFYSGVIAVRDTIQYIRKDSRFTGRKVLLVGHSWGAYSALCAQGDGVVSISAPDSPSILAVTASSYMPKCIAYAMVPVFKLIDLCAFGSKGTTKCHRAASETKVPMLLIHGELDKAVPLKNSAYNAIPDTRAAKYLAAGKYHNPYNTVPAETKLHELSKASSLKGDAKEAFCRAFDFTAATEEDIAVMQQIAGFLDRI
ncbi:MAG: alpha/beta hydrolase [Clostridia bacterium]|nr:alpha/beta hydrolase [Clostridia bacterium]